MLRTRIFIVGGALACAVVGACVFLSVKSPFSEQKVRDRLQRSFGLPVTFGRFAEARFPPGCTIDQVRIGGIIKADHVAIRASWAGLLIPPATVGEMDIGGLEMTWRTGRSFPFQDDDSHLTFGLIRFDSARLNVLTSEADTTPLTFAIHHLEIAGSKYKVSMTNPQPPGEVESSGNFGPYEKGHIRELPVSGSYVFRDANLGSIHGLAGTLFSKGTFDGRLSQIAVNGHVDVAGFHVQGASGRVNLASTFKARVNGTNGETSLEAVDVQAARSFIHGEGTVDKAGAHLRISMKKGRVEDMLRYFSTQKPPSMTGNLMFGTKAEVPPGPGFLKKIRLSGEFSVDSGHFTKEPTQESLNHLSESAQGEKKDQQENDARTMPVRLRSHTEVMHGVAALTQATFATTGVTAQLAGDFNLLTKAIDFHGVLETDGKLSDSASGFKSVVLKVITPLYRHHQETVLPFTIKGTSSHPSLGLDLDSKNAARQPAVIRQVFGAK